MKKNIKNKDEYIKSVSEQIINAEKFLAEIHNELNIFNVRKIKKKIENYFKSKYNLK